MTKASYRALLKAAGEHINIARDALSKMTDNHGQIIFDQSEVDRLLGIISFSLEEAICQIPLELIPNPRTVTDFESMTGQKPSYIVPASLRVDK